MRSKQPFGLLCAPNAMGDLVPVAPKAKCLSVLVAPKAEKILSLWHSRPLLVALWRTRPLRF